MDHPQHYTAKELAGLPGLPGTEQAVNYRARKEGWPSEKRPGKGGGRVYPLSCLPKTTRDHLQGGMIEAHVDAVCQLPAITAQTLPVVAEKTATPAVTELKRFQREAMDARVFFMRLIERAVATGYGVNEAIQRVADEAKAGTLPPAALKQAERANARKSEGRSLSFGGMKKWWGAWVESGKNPVALAPKTVEKLPQRTLADWVRDYNGRANFVCLAPGIPGWLPYFLDEYRRPSKPSAAEALRSMKRRSPAGLEIPSYDQIARLMKKIPAIYLEKGRMTGAEYKSLMGYADRDSSEYPPMTIGQIDGHSFKAYVAHPTTGAHFHPEVCGVICLTTKVLVGWSAGLAESWRTVADAFRHACTVNESKPWGGVLAILEPDRGAGNMAKVNSDECFGIIGRIGTTFLPPEKGGNPQGHGGIERSNQSIWIRAAKDLPTYTGKDMDRIVRKRVYLKLEKDLKKATTAGQLGQVEKTSELLLSWREFLAYLEDWVIRYNNTPHSALAKITAPPPGEPDGKPVRRHMTPFEAWAQAVSDGWKPTVYEGDMLEHLFMPHERITVKRERFTLHGNTYHAYELCRWHGQEMIAAYDIHNAENVWVLDLEERPICVAKWNGNKRHAQPVSVVEKAIMDRENRRGSNLERKLEMVRAEAQRDTIEVAATHHELPIELLAGEEMRRQKVVDLAESRKLRDVSNPLDVYFMILDRIKAGDATAYQLQWKEDYEYWDKTKKKLGLFKDDEYCLKDPADQVKTETEQ
ncbi:transposase [Geomonas limicola]|uniref:Transposase n=1 Tax=Geomonas limicola TaxID=2740186 RepID=A0A6V8N5T2_9BACT|nr:Mu transposase C-terminal domain-containing protein [Geomonas limicola]GFO67918.1 transposase [Geomonas limicola]